MINRIKTHNLLNGILFSIIEFVITSLIIAPFAIYYVLHGKVLYAAVSIGVLLNCLMIVALGVQQYKNKEQDLGIQHMFNPSVREKVNREHPQLGNDTSILVITMLLPFVMFLWVIYELFSRRK